MVLKAPAVLPVSVSVSVSISVTTFSLNPNFFSSSMRSTFTLFRSLTLSTLQLPRTLPSLLHLRRFPRNCVRNAEQWLLHEDLPDNNDNDIFHFSTVEADEKRRLPRPEVEVKELSEVPELWRRSRVAWLCKELPAHKAGTLIRILNAQRKWLRQDDATYIIMHCLRIRENETAFRVSSILFSFHFHFSTFLCVWLCSENKLLLCYVRLFWLKLCLLWNQSVCPSRSGISWLLCASFYWLELVYVCYYLFAWLLKLNILESITLSCNLFPNLIIFPA